MATDQPFRHPNAAVSVADAEVAMQLLLRQLGPTPLDIARSLSTAGVRGERGSAAMDPLVVYLRQSLDPGDTGAWVRVDECLRDYLNYAVRNPDGETFTCAQMALSWPLVWFGSRVDAGDFPELFDQDPT